MFNFFWLCLSRDIKGLWFVSFLFFFDIAPWEAGYYLVCWVGKKFLHQFFFFIFFFFYATVFALSDLWFILNFIYFCSSFNSLCVCAFGFYNENVASLDMLCIKNDFSFLFTFRWFCHFDDDNYVNVHKLVDLLKDYSPTVDWYLGKPSIASPLEIFIDNVSVKIYKCSSSCILINVWDHLREN